MSPCRTPWEKVRGDINYLLFPRGDFFVSLFPFVSEKVLTSQLVYLGNFNRSGGPDLGKTPDPTPNSD